MARDLVGSEIRDFSEETDEMTTDLPDDVAAEFYETARTFLTYRRQRDEMTKLMDKEKPELMGTLEQFGDEDGKGHRAIPLDPPIHGIGRMVRQRKVSRSQDAAKAEAIARVAGIYDRLFKPVMALDEDAVMVALAEGLLTEAQVEEMFPQRITYALTPEKAK